MLNKGVRSFVLVLVLFLAAVSLLRGQTPASWQGWTYQAPPGWTTQETPEALVLSPGAPGTNRVRLLAPQPVSGDLGHWFAAAVAQQAASLRGFRLGSVKPARTTGGAPTLTATAQATTAAGQRVILSYLGVLSTNGQGLLMEAQFDQLGVFRNLRPYGALVKSLEPGAAPPPSQTAQALSTTMSPPAPGAVPGAGASNTGRRPGGASHAPTSGWQGNTELAVTTGPPPPPPTGHDLYDWFGSFYNSVMPGPNFTISTIMVWEFFRFFPNGYVYEGMPAGIDPAAIHCTGPAQLKGGQCKRYTLSGATLTIEGEKPHTFALTDGGIKVDGTDKNRVRPATQPMNGTWKTSSGGGLLTTVTLSQHLLTLRPDGSFSIQGSTGVSGANVAAYGSSAYSGRYKLNGYTIEMDYNNGRVVKQSFLLPYPDDKVFLIGDSMYFVPTR